MQKPLDINGDYDELLSKLERLVMDNPKLVNTLKHDVLKLCDDVKLREYNRKVIDRTIFNPMPQYVKLELLDKVHNPFIRLIDSLVKCGYRNVSILSMYRMWKSLIATNNTSLLTYFNITKFDVPKDNIVVGNDIINNCSLTREAVDNVLSSFNEHTYRLTLCEMLGGISLESDIHLKWKEWAKKHHPDKGGDTETFIKVKIAYDVWCESMKTT